MEIYILLYLCICIVLDDNIASTQVVLSGDSSRIPLNPHESDPAFGGTIRMGTPDLSDEDSQSIHMPKYLACDACRIISMRFSDAIAKEINKYPSIRKGSKELTEDRIDDILENICNDEWTQYGIKEVDGVKRLSGPGFETNDTPGIMQGGGKWPFRFKQMCQMIVGDLGEDFIYETFRHTDASGLEKLMCFSPIEGTPGFCEKSSRKKQKVKSGGSIKESKERRKEPSSSHNEL